MDFSSTQRCQAVHITGLSTIDFETQLLGPQLQPQLPTQAFKTILLSWQCHSHKDSLLTINSIPWGSTKPGCRRGTRITNEAPKGLKEQ